MAENQVIISMEKLEKFFVYISLISCKKDKHIYIYNCTHKFLSEPINIFLLL